MFDRFVSGKRPSWTRRGLLIGSLALHGGVALALVVGSLFHVAELTPPPLAIVFLSAPEAPPPPPPPGHPKAKPRTAATRTQPTTPTLTPPTAPAPTPPADGPGDPNSAGPSDGHGPLDGDPSSRSTGCPSGNCSVSAPAPRPRNVAPHTLDAQRIAGAMPHLPASVIGARRGLGETTFTARLCVDQSGAVSSVTVLSGIPGADSDIVSTVRGWRYRAQAIPVCFITQFVYDVP